MKSFRIIFVLFLFDFGLKSSFAREVNRVSESIIISPSDEGEAYRIAADIFQDYWNKTTGQTLDINYQKLGEHELSDVTNIICIGGDAVNPIVHQLIMDSVIESLDIRYGTDDYRILSVKKEDKNILILAGGDGRSTIYAVYDFFRRQGGVDYFWDGDIFHKSGSSISILDLDVIEKPHFQYRGLRYFAHRGLHRFQAEHWDLDDWKNEIDWLLKSRMNFFMLRTGIDDLFQRAFPDIPYPSMDDKDPDAVLRSYNDRTSFWPLKYRGELRKEVLKYARDRGLLYPEDVGTITHWYSHTPSSFYRERPNFPIIKNQKTGYSLATAAIWDIQNQIAWDTYWKLTETAIRDFSEGSYPRFFHTIGMAERTFGTSRRENFQDKLFVYRKTNQMIRKSYPDVPLLIAGWDFIGWNWTKEEVNKLLSEQDQRKTILLDYADDLSGRETYKDWETFKNFPWIFGLLNSLERNSDIHGDYEILEKRLTDAVSDDKCLGLVLWPELSHYNTFLIEYLARNGWAPTSLNIHSAIKEYCKSRYDTEIQKIMVEVWEAFLPLSEKKNFDLTKGTPETILFNEPQFRILTSNTFRDFSEKNIGDLKRTSISQLSELRRASNLLNEMANLSDKYFENEFWRRDAIDISRTIGSRALFESLCLTVMSVYDHRRGIPVSKRLKSLEENSKKILENLANILSLSDDFSMYASIERLYKAAPINGITPHVNSHSEYTLKGNAENDYCRSDQYELVQYLYREELNLYWVRIKQLIKSKKNDIAFDSEELLVRRKALKDDFYERPLKEMPPAISRNAKNFSISLLSLKNEIDILINLFNADSSK